MLTKVKTKYYATTKRLATGVIYAPEDKAKCYVYRVLCEEEGLKVRLRIPDQVYTQEDIGYLIRHLHEVKTLLREENK